MYLGESFHPFGLGKAEQEWFGEGRAGMVWGGQSRDVVRALLPVQEPCDCSSSGLMREASGAGQFHPTAHPLCVVLVVLAREVIK